MVSTSLSSLTPVLKGVKVNVDDPFQLDFILDVGEAGLNAQTLREESSRLIRYFLASLTVPEKDLWVNLSPYERDRIIPDEFGLTEMGRDLLAEDYILKQLTASVIYPESEIGKKFWKEIYQKAAEKYGTTDIPVDTFNKVWIVPEKAVVYEKSGTAYVAESRLKVMLESDYLAARNSAGQTSADNETALMGKEVIREVVIPVLEREVNQGENFARLRQVYYSLILAAWYKRKVKDSLLSTVYVDQKKIAGVDIDDPAMSEKIWGQYVEAFKKGAYDFIKEERDTLSGELIPRKYFSGGIAAAEIDLAMDIRSADQAPDRAWVGQSQERAVVLTVRFLNAPSAIANETPDAAMARKKPGDTAFTLEKELNKIGYLLKGQGPANSAPGWAKNVVRRMLEGESPYGETASLKDDPDYQWKVEELVQMVKYFSEPVTEDYLNKYKYDEEHKEIFERLLKTLIIAIKDIQGKKRPKAAELPQIRDKIEILLSLVAARLLYGGNLEVFLEKLPFWAEEISGQVFKSTVDIRAYVGNYYTLMGQLWGLVGTQVPANMVFKVWELKNAIKFALDMKSEASVILAFGTLHDLYGSDFNKLSAIGEAIESAYQMIEELSRGDVFWEQYCSYYVAALQAVVMQVPPDYILKAEDVVEVSVMFHPEFSGSFSVNKEGRIKYKSAGELQAEGLTKSQLEKKIREYVSQSAFAPSVSVKVEGQTDKEITDKTKKVFLPRQRENGKKIASQRIVDKKIMPDLARAVSTLKGASRVLPYILRTQSVQKLINNIDEDDGQKLRAYIFYLTNNAQKLRMLYTEGRKKKGSPIAEIDLEGVTQDELRGMISKMRDSAQATEDSPLVNGGIDLNALDGNLTVNATGDAIKFTIDPQKLEEYHNVNGFIPVILNVRPFTDAPAFFGISEAPGPAPSAA